MSDLNELKKILKKWETSFYFVHQKKPNKDDISLAPQNIREAYSKYSALKKSLSKSGSTGHDQGGDKQADKDGDREGNKQEGGREAHREDGGESGDAVVDDNIEVWGKELNKKHEKQSKENQDENQKKSDKKFGINARKLSWGLNKSAISKPSSFKSPGRFKPNNKTLNNNTTETNSATKTRNTSGDTPTDGNHGNIGIHGNTGNHCNIGNQEYLDDDSQPPVSQNRLHSNVKFSTVTREVARDRSPGRGVPRMAPSPSLARRASLAQSYLDRVARSSTPGTPGPDVPPHTPPVPGNPAGTVPERGEAPGRAVPAGIEEAAVFPDTTPTSQKTKNQTENLGFSGIFQSHQEKKRKHSGTTGGTDGSPPMISPPCKKTRVSHRPMFGLGIDRPDSPSTHCEVGWGSESIQTSDKLMVSLDSNSRPPSEDDASPENHTASQKSNKNLGKARSMSNDNFVRLNMKVKSYRRKGKGMTGSQHKRKMWKQKMAARSASYGDKCFKCGESGHWASKCKGKKSSAPEDFEKPSVAEEDFPSISQAVKMARGSKKKAPAADAEPEAVKDDEAEEAEDDEEEEEMLMLAEIEAIRTVCEPPEPPAPMDPYYKTNKDGSLPDVPDEVYTYLGMFGYSTFRHGQQEAVMRVLCGLSTLVVLSTGAGKSLCYQLPAVMYATRARCITLVISPLVSLMEDQVAGLPPGIHGACLHTNMTKSAREKVVSGVTEGRVHFLLVSPEALVSGGGFLPRGTDMPPIAFACIDEAHCVSEWSHHFRPSYLRICKVLREQYGVQCMLGLTATATMVTAASVAQHLGICDYKTATIRETPVPSNLQLSVSRDEDRDEALLGLLQGDRFSCCDSIIVYCTRREQTDRIATLIRTSLKDVKSERDVTNTSPEKTKTTKKSKSKKKLPPPGSWTAECYHAGMSAAQRRRVQNAFMSGRLRVVVATVAFGMGIDKRDIRGVIHYTLPKSYESYVQEIGRAGRDGKPAHCHLFLNSGDQVEIKRHTCANTVDRVVVKKFVRKVFPSCKCKLLHSRTSKQETDDFDDDGVDYSQISSDVTGNDDVDSDVTKNDDAGNDVTKDKGLGGDVTGDVNSDRHENQKFSPPRKQTRVCPGHERAIPIQSTVQELDIKEEGISTLLCYLELHPKRWVENLNSVYATASLQCYGGPNQLQQVAKKCPPVAVAIALQRREGVKFSRRNNVEFNVVTVSDSMGWESGPVKRELKLLQWNMDPSGISGPRKSGVMVEFSDLAFHLRSPGDLTDDEINDVTDFLSGRVETQEKTELFQLTKFYQTLISVSHVNVWMCCDDVDLQRSEKLKSQLEEYFEAQPHISDGQVSMISFSRELDPEISCLQNSTPLDNEEGLRAGIRSFIHLYSPDHTLTGRAIARVLHGIPSPCFPAEVWGRVRRFWRANLDTDFNYLRRLATQELIKCR